MSLPALTSVKSSNIAAIAHRGDNLFVKFSGGNAVYEYAGVAGETYEKMLKSDSIGRFFAHNIKGKHTHRVHDL
jgi:hypothetical protein